MNLQQIVDTELGIKAIEVRLSALLAPDMAQHLRVVTRWASEIRHFAVVFNDVDQEQAAGRMDQERGACIREEAITRLVQTFRPD